MRVILSFQQHKQQMNYTLLALLVSLLLLQVNCIEWYLGYYNNLFLLDPMTAQTQISVNCSIGIPINLAVDREHKRLYYLSHYQDRWLRDKKTIVNGYDLTQSQMFKTASYDGLWNNLFYNHISNQLFTMKDLTPSLYRVNINDLNLTLGEKVLQLTAPVNYHFTQNPFAQYDETDHSLYVHAYSQAGISALAHIDIRTGATLRTIDLPDGVGVSSIGLTVAINVQRRKLLIYEQKYDSKLKTFYRVTPIDLEEGRVQKEIRLWGPEDNVEYDSLSGTFGYSAELDTAVFFLTIVNSDKKRVVNMLYYDMEKGERIAANEIPWKDYKFAMTL